MEYTEIWKSRIVGHRSVDPRTLTPNPKSWRKHPLTQSVIVVNQNTQHVIDGHALVEEAIARSEKVIPVTVVDLSQDEEDLVLAITDLQLSLRSPRS